jgi:disulfide bond formation protein DsbB
MLVRRMLRYPEIIEVMVTTPVAGGARRDCNPVWGIAALGAAILGAAGSVYLSLGLDLKACPLCFYQRSFMMAAAVVLATPLWLDGLRSSRSCLMAFPLAWSGLGVAAFHVYLVFAGKLECPPALFGWSDGPMQSLAVFITLSVLCLAGLCSGRPRETSRIVPLILVTALVGTGVAWACIASAPPLPPRPAQAYDPAKQPFDTCRPPFPGA